MTTISLRKMIVSLSKTFLILIGTTAFSKAQPGRPCNDPSVCQNGATECFDRPLGPTAGQDEVNFVCNCTQAQTIGFACELVGPTYRQDRAEESFQTCYGNDCRIGFFKSVNYPSLYIKNWAAIYLLFIPGAERISFNFEGKGGFAVESFNDGLYIGTGLAFSTDDFQSANIITEDREVRFFDNTTLNGRIFPPPFDFESDAAWFYFYTDNSIQWHGWRIAWQATVDTTPPEIANCPKCVSETIELGVPGTTVTWMEPTATDISGVDQKSSRNPGDFFPIGETSVTYVFTDSSSNTASCIFIVIVQTQDTTTPVISSCPSDQTQMIELRAPSPVISSVRPNATDLSGIFTVIHDSHQIGTSFPVGTTQVTYVFSDPSGNIATCSFNVEVTIGMEDITLQMTVEEDGFSEEKEENETGVDTGNRDSELREEGCGTSPLCQLEDHQVPLVNNYPVSLPGASSEDETSRHASLLDLTVSKDRYVQVRGFPRQVNKNERHGKHKGDSSIELLQTGSGCSTTCVENQHLCCKNPRGEGTSAHATSCKSVERPFKCRFCDKSFKTKWVCGKHEMTHTGEKPFKCRFCEKSFLAKGNHKRHEMIHTGQTYFNCQFCEKSFIKKENYKIHQRKHTGEEPKLYKCQYCGKLLMTKIGCKYHEMMHTSEKTFKCKVCGKLFLTKERRKTHEYTHSGERLFKCHFCEKSFQSKWVCDRHEMIHIYR